MRRIAKSLQSDFIEISISKVSSRELDLKIAESRCLNFGERWRTLIRLYQIFFEEVMIRRELEAAQFAARSGVEEFDC